METAGANEETSLVCQGRGMRIKKPSHKLIDTTGNDFISNSDEIITGSESRGNKKPDVDFVPDAADLDPSSDEAILIDDNAILSSGEEEPAVMEVPGSNKGSKLAP
jgi:hypothetical protein